MTESSIVPSIPQQAGPPPLADTSDMAQVHQVFRDAIDLAPVLIGSAADPQRVELVATYYDHVLGLLHAHHDGEDALIWPRLCERAPEQAAEIRRIADQHAGVTDALEAAGSCLAEWRAAGDADTGDRLAFAMAELGGGLLPHLDEEERFIVPLAAQHLTAPEWGELPSHAMQHFGGDRLWLILGLVAEQMRPDQLAMMEAHMPAPVVEMWTTTGQQRFAEFVSELRG